MKKKVIIFSIIIVIVLFLVIFVFFNPFLNFKLIGDEEINLSINEEYIDAGAVAKIFGIKLDDISIKNNVDNSSLGKYEVKYQIKFLLTKKELIRIVNVIDDIKPELIFTSDIKEYCPNNYLINNFKAEDNIDGDITSKVTVEKEESFLVYKIVDSSNNETIIKKDVIFKDDEAPTITLKGNKNYTQKLSDNYEDPGYNVFDNCDTKLDVVVEGSVDTSKEGTYKLRYIVTDSSNNKNAITRNVIVARNVSKLGYPSINGYGSSIEGPTYINGILIVNKVYSLPSDYNPGVDETASNALKQLQSDGQAIGYKLGLISGYRSYSTQKSIYERNVNNDGYNNTDYASARPGHSEHQTGLAFDVGELSESYGSTPEGIWLANNAHLYGFIIRYPKGKTNITGYSYEPWHIRYVGVEIATEIYNKNITLEEYLNVTGMN